MPRTPARPAPLALRGPQRLPAPPGYQVPGRKGGKTRAGQTQGAEMATETGVGEWMALNVPGAVLRDCLEGVQVELRGLKAEDLNQLADVKGRVVLRGAGASMPGRLVVARVRAYRPGGAVLTKGWDPGEEYRLSKAHTPNGAAGQKRITNPNLPPKARYIVSRLK